MDDCQIYIRPIEQDSFFHKIISIKNAYQCLPDCISTMRAKEKKRVVRTTKSLFPFSSIYVFAFILQKEAPGGKASISEYTTPYIKRIGNSIQ